ncbi:MAG: pyridoxine 5'-phosphate synthase [Candidatus Omnitrophota bacterium]
MPKLGVNIDHIATLRQLRHSLTPSLIEAARICENSGADSIVVHLRQDRRHIQDKDVWSLRRRVQKKFNLEMSAAPAIVRIACRVKPDQVTLVPERRQELTTEGGLDVVKHWRRIERAARELKRQMIDVSLFIEPAQEQIKAAAKLGIDMVEIHTGAYANSLNQRKRDKEFLKIKNAVTYAHEFGLTVHAGHGLDYGNTRPVARLAHMQELNIGYSIVCRSVFVGLAQAVREMKALVK